MCYLEVLSSGYFRVARAVCLMEVDHRAPIIYPDRAQPSTPHPDCPLTKTKTKTKTIAKIKTIVEVEDPLSGSHYLPRQQLPNPPPLTRITPRLTNTKTKTKTALYSPGSHPDCLTNSLNNKHCLTISKTATYKLAT